MFTSKPRIRIPSRTTFSISRSNLPKARGSTYIKLYRSMLAEGTLEGFDMSMQIYREYEPPLSASF